VFSKTIVNIQLQIKNLDLRCFVDSKNRGVNSKNGGAYSNA